jgi:hypothetical protein
LREDHIKTDTTHRAAVLDWGKDSVTTVADEPHILVLLLLRIRKLAAQKLSMVAQARGLAGTAKSIRPGDVASLKAAEETHERDSIITISTLSSSNLSSDVTSRSHFYLRFH